jgi:hypothetical protein
MTEFISGPPFSLDPLMAEARHRMWRRRVLLAAVALVLAAAATGLGVELSSPGAGSSHARAATKLRFEVNSLFSSNGPRGFHVSCNPPRGDVPHPASACAAIASQAAVVMKPKPPSCYGASLFVTIRGRMNDQPVNSMLSNCEQGRLIRDLGVVSSRG